MRLFGFSLLRNAIKYDYCFKESLTSLAGLVEYTVLALGKSEDGTEENLNEINNLEVIHTEWDENLRKSGLILSQQTNLALDYLRNKTKEEKDAWGFYLQADEVIHEKDYDTIKRDIEFADKNGYDAVRFRYFHFWLNHNQIAVGKKWYPVEVRAIKLNSKIYSEKDAQGFSGIEKIFDSEVFIYHYGHVRRKELYELKKKDFHKLYHEDNEIKKAQEKEEKKYVKGSILNYFGSHPLAMKARIESFSDNYTLPKQDKIWILNNSELNINSFIPNINVEFVNIIDSIFQCPFREWTKNLIILYPTFIQSLILKSKVDIRPESKLGDDWQIATYLSLKLAEKNISSNL